MITIDPSGSTIFEDGLTIVRLGDDTFEVGVHVCDISYFIKPHSPLDKEARARGVRVDLVHSHVPMIPEVLTEQITNLVPNKSRFTFSVIWKIDSSGNVIDTWYGKTIIR
ncbi:hypothetical protein G6F68_013985 [Rhizopus microsporus]|nr:hypothetical protein G6F68_013985 [Rhizopus microsporus]